MHAAAYSQLNAKIECRSQKTKETRGTKTERLHRMRRSAKTERLGFASHNRTNKNNSTLPGHTSPLARHSKLKTVVPVLAQNKTA